MVIIDIIRLGGDCMEDKLENKKIKDLKESLFYKRSTGWKKTKKSTYKKVFDFADDYKKFLNEVRTERETVSYFENKAHKHGYENNKSGLMLINNRGKNLMLIKRGKKPITDGVRIIASHVDSPRIDLKQIPMYEENNLLFFHTHYYGGIKKYQWANIPLEIRGIIIDKDGKKIQIKLGRNEGITFVVPDLCPHLSHKLQDDKKSGEVITGENLALLAGSIPETDTDDKDLVKLHLLKLLNEKYHITENDFISSELEVVPAMEAMDLGIDRSMIAGYGQDDRICAYASCKALFDSETPLYTTIVFLSDKEEIGSDGATGMNSLFLIRGLHEAAYAFGTAVDEAGMLELLSKSGAVSADVNGAVNPLYKSVYEEDNASFLGSGIVVTKFTGHGGKYMANDADAEWVFHIRNIFDKADIVWQTGELGKVDEGGGGTVAKFLARYGINVIDAGPALISMHSPYEISSKIDLYESYRAYKQFIMEG